MLPSAPRVRILMAKPGQILDVSAEREQTGKRAIARDEDEW